MKENIQKELDTIRELVLRWKESYLRWVDPEGGNDYLLEDYSEEITRHVSPLVRRFWEGQFLTQTEVHEFLEYCYSQVNDLRDRIKEKEAEAQQSKKGIHA